MALQLAKVSMRSFDNSPQGGCFWLRLTQAVLT